MFTRMIRLLERAHYRLRRTRFDDADARAGRIADDRYANHNVVPRAPRPQV